MSNLILRYRNSVLYAYRDFFYLVCCSTQPIGCACVKTKVDTHPYCPRCRALRGITDCTPSSNCVFCHTLSPVQWTVILKNRRKRENYRAKRRASNKFDTSLVSRQVFRTMASDPDYVPPQGTASELTQLYLALTQCADEEVVLSQDPDTLPRHKPLGDQHMLAYMTQVPTQRVPHALPPSTGLVKHQRISRLPKTPQLYIRPVNQTHRMSQRTKEIRFHVVAKPLWMNPGLQCSIPRNG